MVEALACFFLISFPLAAWLFLAVAKRMYRHHPSDTSLMGKLLSSNGKSLPRRAHPEESRPQSDAP